MTLRASKSSSPTSTSSSPAGSSTASSEAAPEQELPVHPLQRFTSVTIRRDQISGAPYNPRQIGEKERRKLGAIIKKNGLLAGLTWNVRSGHLVGGHQRMDILDAFFGSNKYRLTVNQVDLDEKQEKEGNLALNNIGAQGDWDYAKLQPLMQDKSLDLVAAGFDPADVMRMFGDGGSAQDAEQLSEMADKLRAARNAMQNMAKGSARRDVANFYLKVVFGSIDDMFDFLEHLKLYELGPVDPETQERLHIYNSIQSGTDFRRLYGLAEFDPEAKPEGEQAAE